MSLEVPRTQQAFLAGLVYGAGPRKAIEILAQLTDEELNRLANAGGRQ